MPTAGGTTLDIRNTFVYDSRTKPPQKALLSDLIAQVITGDDPKTSGIYLWADHGVANNDGKGRGASSEDGPQQALNTLKYDKDGKQFGAGVAFLKDDSGATGP